MASSPYKQPDQSALLEPLNIVNPKEKFTSETFTSLCLASNRVILTSFKGSSVLSDLFANPHWIRTAHGINGASADGRFLAIFAPYEAILNVYGLPDLRHLATLKGPGSVGSFSFSPVGNELAINSPAGVRIWNTETWQLARDLTNFIGCLFMPDGQTFWLTSDFRTAGLYNYRTLELLLPLPTGTLPLAVSRDGRYLAASLDARHLQVWDLADVKERLRQLGLDWTE